MIMRRASFVHADICRPPRIAEVRAGSPCEGKVMGGDHLLEIDGIPPLDILDYLESSAPQRVDLRLLRNGRKIRRKIHKQAGIPLGLVFEEAVFDGVRTCRNKCVFCFVDQMPAGLRGSLYIKDDDYRLSFYYGNFITLNNLSHADVQRMKRLRLSPLYVSLHSTNAALRSQIMGGDAQKGLAILSSLLDEGIEVHLQVVLCPGINDGEALRRTMQDVLNSYPAASLAVVPVGLTSFCGGLAQELVPVGRADALLALETVEEYQRASLQRYGRRLFYASDELYVLAQKAFPGEEEYEGYPQLDNGIGMARKFSAEALTACRRMRPSGRPLRGVVTGAAGEVVIHEVMEENGINGVEILTVENLLLGGTVSVTALLGGKDIMLALQEKKPAARELLIPASMLRDDSFIDDLTPFDIAGETGYRLIPVPVDGASFVRALYAREAES